MLAAVYVVVVFVVDAVRFVAETMFEATTQERTPVVVEESILPLAGATVDGHVILYDATPEAGTVCPKEPPPTLAIDNDPVVAAARPIVQDTAEAATADTRIA